MSIQLSDHMAKNEKMQKIGIFTINELRALEMLPEIKNQWEKIYTGEVNSHRLAILELEQSSKIVCMYCARPNEKGQELCQSCGAPLEYGA